MKSTMLSELLFRPDVRAECRETLLRELLLRTFSHDVRGSVMGVMGWVELAAMDGDSVPAGLTRSLERLTQIVSRYDEVNILVTPEVVDLAELIPEALGVPVTGELGPISVPALRLISGLELVRPERVELHRESRAGRSRGRVRVVGAPPEGVQLAMAPHYETLIERLERRDAILGCCLLRVVARSAGGELRGAPPSQLDLYFPIE